MKLFVLLRRYQDQEWYIHEGFVAVGESVEVLVTHAKSLAPEDPNPKIWLPGEETINENGFEDESEGYRIESTQVIRETR